MCLSMERWLGKVAVVTGASAGIGAAIAKRLAIEGLLVVGLARRSERIESLAKGLKNPKGKLRGLKVDVTKEEEILVAFKWIGENLGPVAVLVNNAGIIRDTNLIDGNTQYWRDVFETNVIAASVASREAIKMMREHNIDGHIIHVNSVAGHYVPDIKNFNMYPPSKHALTVITEMQRRELIEAGTKIKVTSLSPGATVSEIVDTNNIEGPLREEFQGRSKLFPEDVADAAIYVLSTPPHVQVHELILRSIAQIK